jgi:hypothetical protein
MYHLNMVNRQGKENMTILKGIPTTAEQWQLSTSMEGSEEAAQKIAQGLSDAIRENYHPEIALDHDARTHASINVLRIMGKIMTSWNEFGATDSEPLNVLDRLISKAFPYDEQ